MENKVEYKITEDKSKMDVAQIHGFLTESYWAKGIPLKTVEKSIANSMCFAVLAGNSKLVAFARVITDHTIFGYLADVFVLPEHRGQGLSKQLMQHIFDHSELQGLRRIMLATKDAHGLYKQYGFKSLSHPETMMENWQPNIYRTT